MQLRLAPPFSDWITHLQFFLKLQTQYISDTLKSSQDAIKVSIIVFWISYSHINFLNKSKMNNFNPSPMDSTPEGARLWPPITIGYENFSRNTKWKDPTNSVEAKSLSQRSGQKKKSNFCGLFWSSYLDNQSFFETSWFCKCVEMYVHKQMVLVPQHVFLELIIQPPDFLSPNLHYACVVHGDVDVSLVWSCILVQDFSPVTWYKCNKIVKCDVTQLHLLTRMPFSRRRSIRISHRSQKHLQSKT